MNKTFVIIIVLIGNLRLSKAASSEENFLSPPLNKDFLAKKSFHPFPKTIKTTKVAIELTPIEVNENQKEEVDTKMIITIIPLYPHKKRGSCWEWLMNCCGCCCGRRDDD